MDDLPHRLDFDDLERHAFSVDEGGAGGRLDRFLADRLADFSRAALQRLIQRGLVTVNGLAAKASARLAAGDEVAVDVPNVLPPRVEPQDLPLDVLFEDDEFVVIAKAPGTAVHPGRGRPDGTVANAIAHRYGEVATRGGVHRPGIVHRLDLETRGAMVVARTERAHAALTAAFKEREVEKEYRALVHGEPEYDEDLIDLPLGRDVHHPTLMAVRFDGGREAQTRVVVDERFGAAAHVRCHPRTGRTHQIRVHLKSRGHRFPHPRTAAPVEVEAPVPDDFARVLALLRGEGLA